MKKETVDLTLVASQFTKEKNYWLKKLSGVQEKSRFFYDSKSTHERSADYAEVKFQFTGNFFTQLMQLSKGVDYTLHMILVSGLVVLLGRWTGNKDIIIGTPIYKQDVEGEFINTVLALRNFIRENMTFKEMLLQVKQTIIEAAENQNYPLERLLYQLDMSPSENDFPLFDVALLLENIHDKKYLRSVHLNMIFSFLRIDECIEGVVEYNSSLYEKTTIERIISHYMNFLKEAVFNVESQVLGIDILSNQEKHRLLVDFSGKKDGYPEGATVGRLFEEQVEKKPDSIAVKYKSEQLSYRELNERANRLARILRKKGVTRDSIVGLMLERSPGMIIGVLAVIKAGGAYLPLGPEYPEERILSTLNDSEVSLLLTREKTLRRFSVVAAGDIKGEDAKIVITPTRPQIKDFDNLPKPDRTLVDYERYHKYIGIAMAKHTVSIQATRGCPYNCAFCHKLWPKTHIVRSTGSIMEEIRCCYDSGVKRFVFIDDIFNLNRKNSSRVLESIIKEGLDIQLFFPNGLRGDILTKDFIDLLIEAGTVNIDLPLESASPRVQKLIGKNLDVEKIRENLEYITVQYPHVLLEMELIIGFPTETEEEALMGLDFLKGLKWVHFPNLNILKIFPNTDMYKLAIENGISREAIERSAHRAFHEIPETLTFSRSFARQFQARFMNEYFLSKERLLHILPLQMKTLTEDELVQKYDSYLPMEIKSFPDILSCVGILKEELGEVELLQDDIMRAPDFAVKARKYFPQKEKAEDAFRVLLLDVSLLFRSESKDKIYEVIEAPLGLMYLLSYLNERFGDRVYGKVAKSRIDFDGLEELRRLVEDFKPDLIGLRTLSYYKDFFHKVIFFMRQWGVKVPIIAGGPYATSEYDTLLKDPHVDLVVLGEGERTLAELVEKMIANYKQLPDEDVLRDIAGLAFLKDKDRVRLKKTAREILLADRVLEGPGPSPVENLENINSPRDLVYVIYTSGSTGKPKGVMLEHRNLVNLLRFDFKYTNIDCSKILQFHTISFDASFHEIFCALLSGGELYLIDEETRTNIPGLLEMVEKNNIKTLFLPMSILKIIFNEKEFINLFPGCVRHIQTAGEQVVISDKFRKYLKENNIYLHNHYGPSETHVVTALTIDPAGDIPEFPSIGKPVLNTDIYILDKSNRLLPEGVPGELCAGGVQVGRGYLGKEDLTKEKFISNPFKKGENLYRTGDLARWLPDGNIEFLGRIDYQVKIRGFRVEPGEIESRLLNHDDIQDAVVLVKETNSGEKYLCAYFVSDRELLVHQLREYLSKDLPDYMVPSVFMQLKEIPLTGSGKVDRKALPEPELKKGEIIPPGNEIEKKVLELWAEVLGIEKTNISIDANFFDLGGHSLRATILINKMHKAFNVKISLAELFASPTIDSLAKCIKKAGYDKYASIEPVEKKGYYALSSAQKRFYFLQQLKEENTTYNIPDIVILEGVIDKEKLEKAVIKLIERHENLRTSYEIIGNEPFQRIHEKVDFKVAYYDNISEAEEKKLIEGFIKPFDLGRATLLRFGLIKKSEDKHILMVDMHHIIADLITLEIIQHDLMAFLEEEELLPLRLQYKDYSEWHNAGKKKEKIKKQEEYWLRRFAGELPVLNLPTDYERPALQTFEGSSIEFEIGRAETEALKTFASNEEANVNIFLLTLFYILLSKISRQEDIIIGMPMANRSHPDLEQIVGAFVNTLALRNSPADHKTFKAFMKEVKTTLFEAVENQDYQFEDLISRLSVTGEATRNPLFSLIFSHTNFVDSSLAKSMKPLGEMKRFEFEIRVSHMDLIFHAYEYAESIEFRFFYSTDLFKRSTIEEIKGYYLDILKQVLNNQNIKLEDIALANDLLAARSTDLLDDSASYEF